MASPTTRVSKAEAALAMLNRQQEVPFRIPLKLAVLLIALAEKSPATKTYTAEIADMRRQIAKQLSTTSGGG